MPSYQFLPGTICDGWGVVGGVGVAGETLVSGTLMAPGPTVKNASLACFKRTALSGFRDVGLLGRSGTD